jgi:polyhydroxybutyrate depolymerase
VRGILVTIGALAACGTEHAALAPDAPGPAMSDGAPVAIDASAAVYPCAPRRAAGHQSFACPHRVTIDVEASAACVAGGCGVIVDVHGFTMSAEVQDAHTRMRTLATARGYVVVQPTAPGAVPSWGLGEHDDVVWGAIEATVDVFDVDPDRVHVTGFSQGGMMSFRQLCAHADRIASVAPVAGGGCFADDEPAVEVPILYVHGRHDAIVSWSLVAVPQRDRVIAAWELGAPTVIASGDGFLARRWVSRSGTVFEMWEHEYIADLLLAGHCIPGPDDGGPYRCDRSEFDLAHVVLDFFAAHPRR